MDETQTLSLKPLENIIDGYIREQNAAMSYWHHQDKIWDCLLGSDAKLFKQEMKNLIQQIKSSKIVCVMNSLVVDVKGTLLYPVEFEFKDVQCMAYFLVAKKGLIDHLYLTPYFFRSEKKRDNIFDFLNKQS